MRVDRPGFRVEELVLVTTLLDEVVYTKEDLAELYLKRWNIELDLRSIKIDMQMDVLRCRTPEGVVKEIWMHALAYNLVRGVIAAAAEEHGEEPRSLSFKGALQALESFREEVGNAEPRRPGAVGGCHLEDDRLAAGRRSSEPGGTAGDQAEAQAASPAEGAAAGGAQTLDGEDLTR